MASSSGKRRLCDHFSVIQTTKHAPRPSLLLKDYLRDDLSSCSSSGFKSFPRRQCCSTVGLKDLQLKHKRRNTFPRRTTPSSSTITVLQRASEAVINVIKSLPLSQKSAKAKKAATYLLSRSLSRKLLSKSFWRKAAAKEEGISKCAPRRRRSFRELLLQERDHKATSFNEDTIFTAPSIITTTTSSSGCGSNSWGESEFTFSSTATSSDSYTENDLLDGTKDGEPHYKIEGVTTTDWPNEKEQFSPVSVLDFPFEDEEEIKSHFNSSAPSFLEGSKHKHIPKRRHFKSVASLEPVALEKRIALSEQKDEPHNHSTKQCSLLAKNGNRNVLNDKIEENACNLLNLVKRSHPFNSLIIKAENLLFDYFKQSIGENNDIDDHSKKLHLCKVVEDWIQGKNQELYLGWEVKEGRGIYIREMDKCGEWKNSDQENQKLALELENEVFNSLINELVLDLTI
ncbi:hypothetical protein SESBI_31341 [Sesbania bispinosa]|nr:hypothetical protein SESBI_31341 [Sesbania bispinosa]